MSTHFPQVRRTAADSQGVSSSGAPPEGVDVQACLRELSGLLWRERVALDRLADALVRNKDEVECEGLLRSVSALELHRAIAAREAALELGLTGDPTLAELARSAPLGWADVLASHRRALVDLTTEVGHLLRRRSEEEDGVEIDLRAGEGANPVTRQPPAVQRSLREFLA